MQLRSGSKRQNLSLCYVAVIISVICAAQTVHAADPIFETLPFETPANIVPVERSNRILQITPYMWATGLDGRISPFSAGPTIGVNKSFSDVINNLNFGGFINIWARNDRFVFSGDIMYVNTTDSHNSGPLPALAIPGVGLIPSGGNIDAKVDTKQLTATFMSGYRAIETPQINLDILGGARIWHISNDVTLTGSHAGLSGSVNYKESFGWVDPLIGLRAFVPLVDKLSLQAQADIGGFGAGSDLTWSAQATFNYVFNDHLSVSLGYKVLDVDYDHKGNVYDTRLNGPILGMSYRF